MMRIGKTKNMPSIKTSGLTNIQLAFSGEIFLFMQKALVDPGAVMDRGQLMVIMIVKSSKLRQQ